MTQFHCDACRRPRERFSGMCSGDPRGAMSVGSRYPAHKPAGLARRLVTEFLRRDWSRGVHSALALGTYLATGRSLFRKYSALLVTLVGGALMANAAIEMYYSYGESREALIA